jgi:hypothetical protein
MPTKEPKSVVIYTSVGTQPSFGIYLLHVFAAAASRKLLEHFGVDGDGVLFVAGLLIGIAAPIAFQLLFRNSAVVRTFVLGERLTTGRHLFTRKDVTPNILAVGKGHPWLLNEPR